MLSALENTVPDESEDFAPLTAAARSFRVPAPVVLLVPTTMTCFILCKDCSGNFWAVLAAIRLCRISVDVAVPAVDEWDGFLAGGFGGIGGAGCWRWGGGSMGGEVDMAGLRGGNSGGAVGTGGSEAKNGFRLSSLVFFARPTDVVLGARETRGAGDTSGTVCAGDRRPPSSSCTEPGNDCEGVDWTWCCDSDRRKGLDPNVAEVVGGVSSLETCRPPCCVRTGGAGYGERLGSIGEVDDRDGVGGLISRPKGMCAVRHRCRGGSSGQRTHRETGEVSRPHLARRLGTYRYRDLLAHAISVAGRPETAWLS